MESLPQEIPVLPLEGALLLPKAQLPIQISDQDHIHLISEVIGTHRIVGLVQPKKDNKGIYNIGCAASITACHEVGDEHLIITLTGITRFRIKTEIRHPNGHRYIKVDFKEFAGDMNDNNDMAIDRTKLLKVLKPYFSSLDMDLDWEEIHTVSNEKLIGALALACPFAPSEKQALLESPNLEEQSKILATLIEMENISSSLPSTSTYH